MGSPPSSQFFTTKKSADAKKLKRMKVKKFVKRIGSEYEIGISKKCVLINRKLRQKKAPQRISIYGEKCQN